VVMGRTTLGARREQAQAQREGLVRRRCPRRVAVGAASRRHRSISERGSDAVMVQRFAFTILIANRHLITADREY
jgi:hypothetical protein